jgi:pimeloyl-ACP methyl ester carboxylesterase
MFEAMLAGSTAEIEATGREMTPGWDDGEYAPWALSKTRFRGADQLGGALQRVLGTPWQELVCDFAIPVLLVCGGDAAQGRIVTAEIAQGAAGMCTSLEVVTFPDAGHNVRRDAYDGYIAAVTEFLDRA